MSAAFHLPVLPESASQPGGSSSRGPHRLAAILECERKWLLRYYHRYISKFEPNFRLIGTLVHMCLAYFFASRMATPPKWLNEKTLDERLEELALGRPEEIRVAKEVFAAFKNRGTSYPWQPLEVEAEFSALLGELIPDELWPAGYDVSLKQERITARVDLAALINGYVAGVDHKCMAPKGQTFERWREDSEWGLHWQSLIIMHLLRKHYGQGNVQWMLIHRVRRVVPYLFDFQTVSIPPIAYEEAPFVALEAVKRERELTDRVKAGGKAVPNFSACYGRYGACDFYAFCRAETPAARRAILANDFDKE